MTQATKLSPEEQAKQRVLVREGICQELSKVFNENRGKHIWELINLEEKNIVALRGKFEDAYVRKTKFKGNTPEKIGAIFVTLESKKALNDLSYLFCRLVTNIGGFREIKEENALEITLADGKIVKYYFSDSDVLITSE
ncbi:hypothetical protein U8V72_20930 [Priestia filamentosa]|uniref:hypothetical protein n=1 Tax=Priestia filamentosa TaxID=1402861 RepID=UPI00397B5B61